MTANLVLICAPKIPTQKYHTHMLQRNVNFEAPNVYAVTSANKFRTLSIDLDIEFLKQSANERLSILMPCI